MPRTTPLVKFADFTARVSAEELSAFWVATSKLGTNHRVVREIALTPEGDYPDRKISHSSAWNMVQDVESIVRTGSDPERTVRLGGELTMDKVEAAIQRFVREGAPFPTADGAPSTASVASVPTAAAPSGSRQVKEGVSDNIIAALTALYEDKSVTFDAVDTAEAFRMMLWGVTPDVIKATAEKHIIGTALETLTKSADAAATIRSIIAAIPLPEGTSTDDAILNAMKAATPALVTAQHSTAAANTYHLYLIAADLNGYEGLIRDAAVAIVRKNRQRSEATEAQVTEARNDVALDTLGHLLDALEAERSAWSEAQRNRLSQTVKDEAAQGGNGEPHAEPVPYESLTDEMKSKVPDRELWDGMTPVQQRKVYDRWMNAAPATETPVAEAPVAEAPAADVTPEPQGRRRGR